MNNKNKLLITGATGLVGKKLIQLSVKYFKKENIFCIVKDSNSHFEREGRKILDKLKIKYIKADLTKPDSLKDIKNDFQYVIHLAANTETLEGNHDINDIGIKNLLNFLNLKKIKHFVHASTVTFIATRPNCSKPLTENSKAYPSNEYSRTKLRAEKILKRNSKKYKFKLTIARLNTIYGKGARAKSLFDTVKNMVKNESLLSKINWPGLTSLIHVEDVAFLLLEFTSKRQNKNIETYLMSAESLTMAEIYKLAYKKYRKKYFQIKIPKVIWKFSAYFRKYIPLLEKLLPNNLYNWVWRLGLIIDDAAWCDNSKLKLKFKKWKPIKLEDRLGDVF